MKKLVTYITVFASAFVLSTNAAEAKSHHAKHSKQVHASSNYTTTYQKVFSHYDRHGCAIYTYKKVIVRKSNNHYKSHNHHNHQPQYTHRASSHTKAHSHRR